MTINAMPINSRAVPETISAMPFAMVSTATKTQVDKHLLPTYRQKVLVTHDQSTSISFEHFPPHECDEHRECAKSQPLLRRGYSGRRQQGANLQHVLGHANRRQQVWFVTHWWFTSVPLSRSRSRPRPRPRPRPLLPGTGTAPATPGSSSQTPTRRRRVRAQQLQ